MENKTIKEYISDIDAAIHEMNQYNDDIEVKKIAKKLMEFDKLSGSLHPVIIRLAEALTDIDESRECFFSNCSKTDWGDEKHDADCPMALAYKIINENKIV